MSDPTLRRGPPEDKKPVPPRLDDGFTERDIKPEKPRIILPSATEIPVATVHWEPGQASTLCSRSGPSNATERWEIVFLPDVRLFRITHTDTARSIVKMRMVPVERSIYWVPL